MVGKQVKEDVSVIIPDSLREKLFSHLFPGDSEEHAAVIAAGIAETARGVRLLVESVFPAKDGVDYVPGRVGYRMLQPQFIFEKLHYCRERKLCYLAVHNHQGDNYVAFSHVDLASHERGYPALLDIVAGLPVGALVFTPKAAAGDIWFSKNHREVLSEVRIVGRNIERLQDRPAEDVVMHNPTYDRQVLLFGKNGQDILAKSKVGVIGAGGIGSLIVEYLAHLGVGHLLVVDNKRIKQSNRSRVVGATIDDVSTNPRTRKIDIAERVAKQANSNIIFEGIFDNFSKNLVAQRFVDCDFIFLAADSMQARLIFNAIVHQYLIPGVQTGAKVKIDEKSGRVVDVFSVSRWVTPDSGCLWCNGLILRDMLALEAKEEHARIEQTYGTMQDNPSVITLNAVAASHAVNDFMVAFLGLGGPRASLDYQRFQHIDRRVVLDQPRRDAHCIECGTEASSRRARGGSVPLPTLAS